MIIKLGFAKSKTQAVEFGNKLIDKKLIKNALSDKPFRNTDQWYQFIKIEANFQPRSISDVPREFKDPITNVCDYIYL